MRRGAAGVAAVAACLALAAGACGGRTAAGDGATETAGEGSGRVSGATGVGTGGSSLAIATSVPVRINTPVSAPPSGPGVSVTVPPEKPCTIEASFSNEVLGFAYDSAVVSPDGEARLRAFVAEVLRNSVRLERVELVGFASSEGADDYNLALSRQRALSAKVVLSSIDGIGSASLDASGRGEDKAIGDNSIEAGRERNRRVEVSFHFSGCK